MKYISIQEAFGKKFERQRRIKNLKYHALGNCVHIGKISPGCISCFKADPFCTNFNCGAKCNLNCIYCPSDKEVKEFTKQANRKWKKKLLLDSKKPDYNPLVYSFSGGGEPLLYIDLISEIMKLIHNLTKHLKRKPWLYLYTNGTVVDKEMILKLRDLGFDEIRFHLGATNFSKGVYQYMSIAVKYLNTVTVETPAWPPHRKQLFQMLPIIEDIGVKHLNLTEIEFNENNTERILRALPNAKIYPCYQVHLVDEGLTYDIIEEVIKKKYSYSVLDCSCFVKLIQRGKARGVCFMDLENMISREI